MKKYTVLSSNYGDVDYADSSSFGLLLKINRSVGGRVSVENVKPNLRKLFKLAGFDHLFLKDEGRTGPQPA